jgi:hypothetical protein
MAAPSVSPQPQTQSVRILAEDPGAQGGIFADVDIPFEDVTHGPCGARVRVIDYDASTGKLLRPAPFHPKKRGEDPDITSPEFHAVNVYAIMTRTLARFEFALGRRVAWSFDGHQIFAAPHAFCDANAFYSRRDHAIFFGYFTAPDGKTVFTSLSHDVIAHETTHALLDGLRQRFTDPSSPDQAAFHEGFADVVALLSIFSIPDVVERSLDLAARHAGTTADNDVDRKLVGKTWLTRDRLKESVLFGLGKQIGQELAENEADRRKAALRRSVTLDPKEVGSEEFQEPHRRGEILVAAMLNSFLDIWLARIKDLGTVRDDMVDRGRVAEDGSLAADHLLTMAIRALDYCPPADLLFSDYLSALLTADYEIQTNDSKYRYRDHLRSNFARYNITPTASASSGREAGVWTSAEFTLNYGTARFESMRHSPDEIFRFIWQNREQLGLEESAFTKVISVRPCTRLSSDGFTLQETVAEYLQMLTLKAGELDRLKWDWDGHQPQPLKPQDMPPEIEVRIYGGGSLVFDEFGRLKYHVHNWILNGNRQVKRLKYLWDSGAFDAGPATSGNAFAAVHRLRWTDGVRFDRNPEVIHAESF